jgi:hypothetical protein
MKEHSIAMVLGLILCLFAPDSYARTWHINPEGTGDASTVQAGLDSAASGDTVSLACGTYYEHDILMKAGVCLRGSAGFPPCATVDAQQQNTLMTCYPNFLPTVIEGVALTHAAFIGMDISGLGLTVRDCMFSDNPVRGSVIRITFGSPAFYNCLFYHNLNEDLLPAPVIAVAFMYSQPLFSHCTIVENSAGVSLNVDGGATIENSIIAFCMDGYTFGNDETNTPLFLNCTNLFGNHAGEDSVIAATFGSGCFSADPQFCGVRGSGNLFLQSDSPCAPGNHPSGNDCGLVGAMPINCGKVAAENKTWGAIKSLFKR